MGTDGNSSRVSNLVTNLIWLSRFMQVCHKMMRYLSLSDKAVD